MVRVILVLIGSLIVPSLAVAGSVPHPTVADAEPLEPVPGTGRPRPRIAYSPGQEDELRDRLTREPYRSVFLTSHARAEVWNARPLGDDTLQAHRDLSRAAKWLAFEYALDRTVIGGAIVAFPDAAARQATGERVRELLGNLYPRSRLAVPPPIGGWDRDISTSEEIVSYATAYDTLLGAGFDLGPDREVIADRLASVTGELHRNFVDPASASGYTDLHQNNHRSKSGAAMAVAAVALADERPADARAWWDTGVLYVDDVLRHTLMAGDGAYAEGPFYYRLTLQNLLPLLATWERLRGDQPWRAEGFEVPAMTHHPQFRRTLRWLLDTTVPSGAMAPIDDGNPGRSTYFGALPGGLPETPAHRWRWATAPTPYETDGSIDLSVESIVAYDDAVVPRPPWWSPTQFYVEGGTATLRSDWSADAVMALVLGEHDTAAQFGRDRLGVGRWPQSHEHMDPGSFLLHAFGERLALDPGYLSFAERTQVNAPQHHNTVLVDGNGPADYLQASIAWRADPLARPPAEGMSTLHRTLDGEGLDGVSVATRYRDTEVQRRFVLADDRYLVVADGVDGPGGALAWMVHGNGGGTSGGTFEATPTGGRWQIGGARLDSGVAVVGATPALTTETAVHQADDQSKRTHTAVRATVTGGRADAVQVLYPTRAGSPAPALTSGGGADEAWVEVLDAAGDRRVRATRTDGGALRIVDTSSSGALRVAYAERTDRLTHDGDDLVVAAGTGTLGVRLGPGRADVVADTAGAAVELGDLGFVAARVDGACGVERLPDGRTRLRLNRERRVTLSSTTGNARPAADAGPAMRVPADGLVALDGRASCDADGDALTPTWELVSAPAGSAWRLDDPTSWRPRLGVDRPGPYRIRLVVRDDRGNASLEQEVLVVAGDQCADGVDDDLDGRIDTDDPDCDGPASPPPPPVEPEPTTTTPPTSTTSTPTSSTTVNGVAPAGSPTVTADRGVTAGAEGAGAAAMPTAPPAVAVRTAPRFTG